MDMDEDFEAAPLGPLFVNPITTLELKVLYNIIVFSKNSDQYLFFEGSIIFIEIIEMDSLALRKIKPIFGFILSSIDISKNEEIL